MFLRPTPEDESNFETEKRKSMFAKTIAAWIMVIFVGALAVIILWKIYTNDIDLKKLVSEQNGDASMSRFQFLIFTFVIALMWIYLFFCNECKEFPNIPTGVLGLIGISGGTYVVSKGIQKSFEGDQAAAKAKVEIANVAAGKVGNADAVGNAGAGNVGGGANAAGI
jgi:dolichyl-phosphate-mannose--protein O-mannosyl transferase